jgi:hypothetical protein
MPVEGFGALEEEIIMCAWLNTLQCRVERDTCLGWREVGVWIDVDEVRLEIEENAGLLPRAVSQRQISDTKIFLSKSRVSFFLHYILLNKTKSIVFSLWEYAFWSRQNTTAQSSHNTP